MDVKEIRIPTGTYMLLWFTNPNRNPNGIGGIEQGLCTEFYTSLQDAERSAQILSGSKIILMCTAQNPPPDSNVYWDAVRFYGNFNLNELTLLPDKYRQEFIRIKDLTAYLNEAKQKQWAIDMGDLMRRYNLNQHQVRSVVDSVFSDIG